MPVHCPPRWETHAHAIEALLEGCIQTGIERFGLALDRAPTVHLFPWGGIEFLADWERNEILLGYRSHPAVDQVLYSVYFGLCHEVGHLLWHPGNLILREAWASLFALQVLTDLGRQQVGLTPELNRLVLAKDRILTRGVIWVMPLLPGDVGRIGRVLRAWRRILRQGRWPQMRRFLSSALEAEALPAGERTAYLARLLAETLACTLKQVERWLFSTEEARAR